MSTAQTPAFDTRTSAEITLAFPIEVDGRKIEKVTMRRPKVRDTLAARKVSKDPTDIGIFIIASLCEAGGVPLAPENIHEMDEVDANRLQEQYDSFRGQRAE